MITSDKRPLRRARFIASAILATQLLAPTVADASEETNKPDDIFNLSLEDLLSLEVTSASKKKQSLNEVAAAIFVITQEDIRRSGVISIPEALRLAPGIQVSRFDSNKWAITSRGFNHQFSNKLLVMIDGRSIYTPSFSGVFWDVQDTLLEDIDRIEVIRGPGSTIWGANAVNGVINIITKNAADTRGTLISAGAGNEIDGFANLRYGFDLSDQAQGRVYFKTQQLDSSWLTNLQSQGYDSVQSQRAGFRVDTAMTESDRWTFQGDIYDVDNTQTAEIWKDPYNPANAAYAPFFKVFNVEDQVKSSGWNLQLRWDHQIDNDANTSLQIYYDKAKHAEALLGMDINTADIDFRHQLAPTDNQDLIWGIGFRAIDSSYDNTFLGQITPADQLVTSMNIFIQDEIKLTEMLALTVGSKFEHHETVGNNFQPTLRLAWAVDDNSLVWGSISRAVRTPSAVESRSTVVANIVPAMPPMLPQPVVLYSRGNPDAKPEKMLAYESGIRLMPATNFSIDVSIFYNVYDDIQTIQLAQPDPFSNIQYVNGLKAITYGGELSADWRPLEWWKVNANYSTIELSTSQKDPDFATDFTQSVYEGSVPRHQIMLHSLMDLSRDLTLDAWWYYTSELSNTSFSVNQGVPAYNSFNTRVSWRAGKNLQLSIVGRNLNKAHHTEFVGENFLPAAEIERSIYAQVWLDFE